MPPPPTTEIRLLYQGDYRETLTPAPAQRQTDPPTVPITQLYPGGSYPKGKEEPYTVSAGKYTYTTGWAPSNPATLGTSQSALIRGVASFQGSRLEGVHCILGYVLTGV